MSPDVTQHRLKDKALYYGNPTNNNTMLTAGCSDSQGQ